MTEREYTDYASVRDALLDAQDRRGFLSYEQKLALQHAEWAGLEGVEGVDPEDLDGGDRRAREVSPTDDHGSVLGDRQDRREGAGGG